MALPKQRVLRPDPKLRLNPGGQSQPRERPSALLSRRHGRSPLLGPLSLPRNSTGPSRRLRNSISRPPAKKGSQSKSSGSSA
jgi:hypothetical protein